MGSFRLEKKTVEERKQKALGRTFRKNRLEVRSGGNGGGEEPGAARGKELPAVEA